MGALRAVIATALLAIGITACGSSARGPSAPDRVALKRIDILLTSLTLLQGQINIAPSVRSHVAYVRSEGPLIDQFGRSSRELGREILSLRDVQAAKIYVPLGTAIAQDAKDMKLFLKSVIARNDASTKLEYAQLNRDEIQINQVALQQFPKARAYAQKAAG
ncbi:MAG: hypothetical protein ACYC91_00995 [Solirubrobacteraceae bacterium]